MADDSSLRVWKIKLGEGRMWQMVLVLNNMNVRTCDDVKEELQYFLKSWAVFFGLFLIFKSGHGEIRSGLLVSDRVPSARTLTSTQGIFLKLENYYHHNLLVCNKLCH